MFQFLHAGQFLIAREAVTEDALTELALEAGADDIITTAEGYELRCALHAFDRIAHALDDRKIKPASAELAYIPTTTVAAPTGHLATDLAELHESLDALDDVQHVFSNEDAP
jgi:transcriptional/translational regulatory protein YebC/TACO1